MGSSDLRCFRAPGRRFAIRAFDQRIGDYLHHLMSGLSFVAEPDSTYDLSDRGAGVSARYVLTLDDEVLVSTADLGSALDYLLWHVNREVVRRCQAQLALHAAAAEHEGAALVLAGPSGAGKSTLVAGLVQRGLRYLTDEVVVIDPVSLVAEPFAKPIVIEQGSQDVLRDLEPPRPPAEVAGFSRKRWLVSPTDVRDNALAPASPVRWVVALRYEAGGGTALSPLRPAAAVHALASNCGNLAPGGQARLEALASVVGVSTCWELVTGDLGRSCDLVQRLVELRPQVTV